MLCKYSPFLNINIQAFFDIVKLNKKVDDTLTKELNILITPKQNIVGKGNDDELRMHHGDCF